jgi:hypothetical protein
MGMFDVFVGSLQCPVCGTVSEQEMQTIIRDNPDWTYLRVNDPLKINQNLAELADYKTLKIPKPNEKIYLLSIWDGGVCPSCSYEYNWGQVMIQDEIIKEISDTYANRKTLENANFIDVECICWLESNAECEGSNIHHLLPHDLLNYLIYLTEVIESKK